MNEVNKITTDKTLSNGVKMGQELGVVRTKKAAAVGQFV